MFFDPFEASRLAPECRSFFFTWPLLISTTNKCISRTDLRRQLFVCAAVPAETEVADLLSQPVSM